MHPFRSFIAAAVVVIASLAASAPAMAHENPAGCAGSGINLQLYGSGIFNLYRDGDVVSLTPQVSNNAANVCDITDATLTLRLPKADGSLGPDQVIASGLDLPAGTPPTKLPDVQHKLDLDDALFRGQVQLKISGTVHGTGTHTSSQLASLGTSLVITRPHATIAVTADPPTGDAPLGVTYKYAVTNDTPIDPHPLADTPPPAQDIALTDDRCGPIPAAHTGDTNTNGVMERGETWVYSCTTTLPGGTFTNHVRMTANSAHDGRPWPATTGQSTVTVNGPDMTVTKSHTGDFQQGDKGRSYSLVARNSGNRAATGSVSVADTLPSGLGATAVSGAGWDCTLVTLTCSRSDALAAGESYPPITVTVDVAADAPAAVTNTAKVTRAGQNTENDGASDPTTIAPLVTPDPAPGDQPGGGDTGGDTGGTGTDTPRTDEGQTPADATAPALSPVSISNRKFAVVAPRVTSAGAKKGTRFAYTLTESARVVFTVERRTVSRRSGRVRYVRVGEFTQAAKAGANSRRWLGTLGSKTVKPGAYRASIVATDAAGNKSAARRVGFKVVRR